MKHRPKTLLTLLSSILLLLIVGCSRVNDQPTEANDSTQSLPEITESPSVTSTPTATALANPSSTVAVSTEVANNALEYIYSNIDKLGVCQGEVDRKTSEEASNVYKIDEQKYLVELMCFLAAYQGSYEYFLYRQTPSDFEVTPLTLSVFELNEAGELKRKEVRSIGGLPEYDPEKQLLTVFTKYRGLGDCGSWAQYKFSENELQLLEYRDKQECDGNYLDPVEYPKIYP